MGPPTTHSMVSNWIEGTRERLGRLINEGTKVEATSGRVDINQRPDYFDEVKFRRAQVTCNKYYSNLSIASTSGLMLLVQIESILKALLRTGKSRTVPELFDRYVATAKYIRKCYETDFYDSTSEGWKYIMLVRGMHTRVHQMMNQKSDDDDDGKETASVKPSDNYLWVNQYDMALTQFAFIGLFLMKPKKTGAYNCTREEFSDVTYYWRLMSYYFGIEERFNIFVYHDDPYRQLEFFQAIFDHQQELLQQNRCEVGTEMAKGIMLAFEDLTTELSFNILDHWWWPFVSLSGQKKPSPYTLADRWKLVSFYFIIYLLMPIEMLRGTINRSYKKKFDKFCESSEKIKAKLTKKYNHLVYE